jgi:hypothetical protein
MEVSFFLEYIFRMRKTGKPPHLTVIGSDLTASQPPRPLGEHGRALWDRVRREYDVSDVAGSELLCLAGQALDRAESLAERIREDGEIVRTPGGIKAHPAVREELSARGFVVRTLTKLGLNYEPLRVAIGRPPGVR